MHHAVGVRSAAQQPDQRLADRGVGEAPAPLQRVRDRGPPEDLFQQLGGDRPAVHDRDLPGRRPGAQQRADLLGEELELAPLIAALQQSHRAAVLGPPRAGLEQRALEMGQRPACPRRVVVPARLQDGLPGGQRRERLVAARAPGERRAPRLEGERHRHLRVDHRAERLDRVELQPRQVVEAVEQHRRPAPACRPAPQRIQRAQRALLLVAAAHPLEQPLVLGEQLGQLIAGGFPPVEGRQRRQRAAQPRRE